MQCYVRSNDVVSRVIAGETLIIPVRKGVGDLASIFSLNEVASAIWRCVASPQGADEIVVTLEQEFAATRDDLTRDVETFLHEMTSAGLIRSVAAGAVA